MISAKIVLYKLKTSTIKFIALLTIVSFFLLSLSTFNKTYIPVNNDESGNGAIESCPEHIKKNKLAELIRDAIGQTDDKDNTEKICFCYHTDLRKNLKYFPANPELQDLSLQISLLTFTDYLQSSKKISFSYNNKAPPVSNQQISKI